MTPAPKYGYVSAGVGMGELVHAEAGWFADERWSIDASAGWLIFNPLIGLGATAYWLGDATEGPPVHSLMTRARLRFNPTLKPLRIWGNGGETIGATAELYVGYSFIMPTGFLVQGMGGAVLYDDGGKPAVGPNFLLSLGYAF